MTWIIRFANSSIVKKQLMALTGLLLTGFLVSHLAGNLLIVISAEAFNWYAHKLVSNPFIYLAEFALAVVFLVHFALAIRLTVENRIARGQNYYKKVRSGRGASFASSTMMYTGIIILVFLILHIWHFKFGSYYAIVIDGVEIRDLHRTVMEYFQHPLHVIWYVLAMACVAIHLSHGIASTFQSFGINAPKYNCGIKYAGKFLALFLAIGFSAISVWAYFQGVNS